MRKSFAWVVTVLSGCATLGCAPRVVGPDGDQDDDGRSTGVMSGEDPSTGAVEPPPPEPDDDGPLPPPQGTTGGGVGSSESSSGTPSGMLEPGDATACLTGGNVLILHGEEDDYIHPGYEELPAAEWSVTVGGSPLSEVELSYRLDEPDEDYRNWRVWVRTSLVPVPLEVGPYEGAQRAPFEDEGRPGLSISGDGRGCNRLSGSFEVHELAVEDDELQAITATWSQYCERGDAVLHGCVHWDAG